MLSLLSDFTYSSLDASSCRFKVCRVDDLWLIVWRRKSSILLGLSVSCSQLTLPSLRATFEFMVCLMNSVSSGGRLTLLRSVEEGAKL